MISVSFEITKKDYYQTQWLYSKSVWPTFLLLVILYFPLSCCLSNAIISGFLDIDLFSTTGLLIIFLIFLGIPLFFVLVIALILMRGADKNTANGPIHMDFSEENVHVNTNLADAVYQWTNFSNLLESDDLFLVFFTVNQKVTYIVPKRAFESPEQIEAFRSLLAEKKIEKLKPINKSNRILFILLISFFVLMVVTPCFGLALGLITMLLGLH